MMPIHNKRPKEMCLESGFSRRLDQTVLHLHSWQEPGARLLAQSCPVLNHPNQQQTGTHKARVWASQPCVLPLFFTSFLPFLPSIFYHNKKLRLYHSNIRAPSSWLLNARSKQPTSPLSQLRKMNDTKNPVLWDLSRKVHSKEATLACSLFSVVVQEHLILFWLS